MFWSFIKYKGQAAGSAQADAHAPCHGEQVTAFGHVAGLAGNVGKTVLGDMTVDHCYSDAVAFDLHLRAMPNVILTDHTAFYTYEDVKSMVRGVMESAAAFAEGSPTRHDVTNR